MFLYCAIDKTDVLCYNTDMNDIVFAGIPAEDGEHKHKGWEIICASSRGVISSGGAAYSYKKGDVIVVPRQIPHVNAEGNLCVWLENALLPADGIKILEGERAEEMTWVCARAKACLDGAGPKSTVVLDGLGCLLRAFIAAYCSTNEFSPTVKSLMSDIDKNISDSTYSLENSIRNLPLNYDYVRKLFKSETGLTPLEYLTAKRMSFAREIMLSGITNRYSNYTISQIAEMCGFAEPLYFSRVFKKYYGVSPTEYMQKNK